MPLLAATNVHFTIGQDIILAGATLTIEPGQRIGLVGRNGTGKTTLMRILAGQLKADTGLVMLQKGARVGYLTQDPVLDPARTLREEAASGFAELARLHAELDGVFHQMSEPADTTPEMLEWLLKRQSDLQHRLEAAGGYAVDHKIDAILHGLGFADGQFGIKVKDLSGGQKGRLALAKLLLESPDLLMLDEPTNHLDIVGREWLEEFLAGEYRGAVLIVSHDRYMLDRVIAQVEEVEQGRLINYPGNYSAYSEIRYERRLTQHRAYQRQQDKFRKEEAYIRRYKAGQRARQAKGRQTRLERERRDATLERPMEVGVMKVQLPKAPRAGDLVVVVRGASKKYGTPPDHEARARPDKVLFHDLTVTISRGEHWGIIGPNGAGKTTLVRAMLGHGGGVALDSGTVKLGSNVVVGYYSQLPGQEGSDLPVYRYLQEVIRKENPESQLSEQQARDLAGAFLFSGSDQEKPIGSLSGGERSRARLAGLLASAKNLLVLDEPTNHLDIQSAERLEDALTGGDDDEDREGGFDGTLILISHDRALIDAVCDHLLILDGEGGVEVFHGNYSDWHVRKAEHQAQQSRDAADAQQSRRRQEAHKSRVSSAGAATAKAAAAAPATKRGGGGGGGRRKGGGKGVGWMPTERLEGEIERVGSRIAEVDRLLGDVEVYRDSKRCSALLDERAALVGEQARLEEEWLRRAEDA